MESGGNQKLKDFLEKYSLNDEEIKLKYTTRASQFYRKQLQAQATRTPFFDPEPSVEEGRKLILDGTPIEEARGEP